MAEKLKILYIIEAAGGGAGRHVCDLAQALAEKGHSIHVIYSPNRGDPVIKQQIHDLKNIAFKSISIMRNITPLDAIALKEITKYIKENGPFDLIHGHGSKGGVLGAAAGRLSRTPTFYTPHAFATNNASFSIVAKHFFKWIIRVAATQCEKIICVSDYEKEHGKSFVGIAPEKLVVIHNGIEPYKKTRAEARKDLGIGPDDFCIGCVAMFYEYKGVDVLIPALAEARHYAPQAKLVIAGDGPAKNKLHNKAKTAGLHNKIQWLGAVKGQDVMPAFDVMSMPSRSESFPYVLLEALEAGVPVIASNVGGTSEIIQDGVNGILVAPERPDEITAALHRIIDNRKMLATLARNAKESSKRFQLESMVTQTLSLYHKHLKR
ncbi:MAG: glycosyltransferase family 1 protein [Proteobacteria bacterium]|nr:glycosyltransferase family 1 protein [Pseudomonadota bacterium]